MIIFPAIDIQNGKCVRLRQGAEKDSTVYFEDPEEAAVHWEKEGAEWLHLVDLDGAFRGEGVNTEMIKKISRRVSIPVEVGGGIRTMDDIRRHLRNGVSRVIIGSMAVENPDFASEAAARWPGKIAVSVDAKGDWAAIHGWVESSGRKVVPFVRELIDSGISVIIYTDISRDGMLTGPNTGMLERLQAMPGISLIASGGVSSAGDLKTLKDMNLYGAICGKALYEGRVTMKQIRKIQE